MLIIKKGLAEKIATELTKKHRAEVDKANTALVLHVMDIHQAKVPKSVQFSFRMNPAYIRTSGTATWKDRTTGKTWYFTLPSRIPARDSNYIQVKASPQLTAWKRARTVADQMHQSLVDFLTGKSVKRAAKELPEILTNAEIKAMLAVQAKADQQNIKARITAAGLRRKLNAALKMILVILMLSITVAGSAQTSKDTLVLKMHRAEWKAASDTLQFLILPAIGRSRSADDADKLQTWFASVIGRMYYRLDTIPIIKKPK